MKNKIFVLVGLLAFMMAAISFTPKTDMDSYDEAFMQGPQNLQVLPKDIDPEVLKSIMFSFNKALGVKCGYCHAPSEDGKELNFASDEKVQKHISRSMMVMTNEINQKYFDLYPQDGMVNQISCMTCHNGEKKPFTYQRPVTTNNDAEEGIDENVEIEEVED